MYSSSFHSFSFGYNEPVKRVISPSDMALTSPIRSYLESSLFNLDSINKNIQSLNDFHYA